MSTFFKDLIRFEKLSWPHWILIFLMYTVLNIPGILKNSSDTNLAVGQASAFLHGQLHLDKYIWDAASYKGQYYSSYPPFPSVVMLPFVAVFGTGINSVLISLLISFVGMYFFYKLLLKLMPFEQGRIWIFSAFFIGSGHLFTLLTSDHIYGFAHVVCTSLLFMLLWELNHKQRPIWVGCLWGFAFLTRQMTLFYGFLVLYYLYFDQPDKKVGLKKTALAMSVFFLLSVAYLLFNYARFGSLFDTGYQYLLYTSPLRERVEQYGTFNVKYLFFNLYHLFIKGHNLIFTGNDYLKVASIDQYGTSLLSASPYVVFSLKTQADKQFKFAYWITIVFLMIGVLLYQNNGWYQVNTQRFSLDFLPALMILVIVSFKNTQTHFWLLKLFAGYAIVLNLFSFFIHGITD